MPGDERLGMALRELRTARALTLATVARQAGCAESLLSYVETGHRQLQPWLAESLDTTYGTGGAVIALVHGGAAGSHTWPHTGVPEDDVLLVHSPEGGVAMPVSRRDLLTGLSIGALGGTLLSYLDLALAQLDLSDDPVASFGRAFAGFQSAARVLPPARLIDGLTGHVALLEALRRRVPADRRGPYAVMQARYAESLSWLSEEAGDLHGALYWTDRAAQWAQAGNWPPMAAYSFVRRSMMTISFTGDGMRAISAAQPVLELPDASARVKGLAATQMAFGYALARDRDASARALDNAMQLLAAPVDEGTAILGQRSVASDDLYTIYRTTCDVYLGRGESVIPVLESTLSSLVKASARTATITRAKLARAYANAGQPAEACRLAWDVLDTLQIVGSLSAHSVLRRSLPILRQWPGRDDVQAIQHRLRASGATSA
ncbi:MAG: helix-turn-helix domain-containing protein [Pseudonocardia sp.]